MKIDIDQKRWLILVACCLTNLCIGSVYAWSVYAVPLAQRLTLLLGNAVTAGDLSIAFTIATALCPVALIFGGAINDRLGARWIIFGGGLAFGGGMLLLGRATSIVSLMLTFGVMVGLAGGLAYGCTVATCVKYFPDKRGLIGGISVATYGLSSVIVPLIATPLIDTYGIVTTVTVLGIGFSVIICPCALVIDKCPDEFFPKGWSPAQGVAGGSVNKDKNWREMIRDPLFYVMLAMLVFGAFSGLMVISQASPVAQALTGMSPQAAAAGVSVLALFNTAGRILAGYLSDRIGRVNCLTGVFALAAMGMILLYINTFGGLMLFYGGLCLVGLCFGSIMGVFPSFTADQFGAKNNSVNYGMMFIGFGLAGLLGPLLMKTLHASSGTYQTAFLVATILAVAGLFSTFIYRFMASRVR